MADRSTGAFGEFEAAAKALEKRLAGIRRNAEGLVADEEKIARSRTNVRQRLDEEARRGRVSSDTVVSEGAVSRRGRNVADEARLQRQAAEAQSQRLRGVRGETQAVAQLTRTRDADLRSLQRLSRQGPYPFSRNITETQLQAQRLQRLRALAAPGITPILTGYGGVPPIGGGPRPPAPPGGAGGGGRPPRTDFYRQAAAEVETLRQRQAQWIQTMNAGNTTLRRHGALTTEFFQEAARGTVTIRELGFQTAATIGKFGGWLTAGAALFGALSIVQNFTRGMLDASAGVNDVQRVLNNVDTERLRSQFSDLSEHFNVPIKDASEAVYQMAKVFKDQDDAALAARTSLYAVKIGELDVATATRYFTAIIHGANLGIGDLQSLMDQVNQAQNNFGVSIQGTLAGLAKASGSYRNLGGDVQRYLLPLIAASQYLTGQTGDVAGTAFQRIPNFLSKPNNQATLRQYGINPDANVDRIIQRAINLRASGKVDDKQIRQIAFAIFGTFYGPRIGLPLLQNPQTVAQFQRGPGDPRASAGSSERELQRLLKSIQERIIRIGIELQRLGEEASKTGLLDFFGALVVSLGSMLSLMTGLLREFNNLPEGLRKALSYGLQLLIAFRLMQRVRLGELLVPPGQEGRYGAARNAVARGLGTANTPIIEARLSRKAIADEARFFEEQTTQEFRNAALANTRGQIASERIGAAKAEYQRMQEVGATEESLVQQRGRIAALTREYARAQDSEATAQVSAESGQQQLLAAQQRQARTRRRFRNLLFGRDYQQDVAAQQGRYIAAAGPGLRPRGVPGGGLEESRARARAAADLAVAEGRTLGGVVGGTREQIERVNRELGIQTAQANRARPVLGRLRSVSSRFSLSVNGFLGAAGNLFFAAAIGATAGELIAAVLNGLGNKMDASQASLDAADQSAQGLRSRMDRLRGQATTDSALGQTLDDITKALFGTSPSEAAQSEQQRLADILALQNRQRRINRGVEAGTPGALQFLGQDDLQERIRKLKKVGDDGRVFNRQAARVREEINASGLPADEIQALQAELTKQVTKLSIALKPGTLRQRLRGISDPKQLQTMLEGYQSLQEVGTGGSQIERAALVYRRMTQLLGRSHDPEAIKQLAEARKAFQEIVQHQLDIIGARGELRGARINQAVDPVGKQRIALQTLQRQFRFMQENRKAFDLKDILALQAQITDARIQLQEEIRQQAEEIAHARFDVLRARAGDNDVKTARVDIQQALYDLQHARTPAERLTAQADLINARRNLREQIASRQIEDIQFQADIGKLTLDQQIAAYRRLLKTAQLTRDQRRDLKRQIHQLKQQEESDAGGFELDVGNIKLPTVYEIRRAIGGGYGGSQVNVTNAPNVTVNVANSEDVPKVSQALDNSLGGGTAAAMRNAGLIS